MGAWPSVATAQWVDGSAGAVLPRGSLRVTFGGTHQVQRDRYVDGIIEGIGGPLTSTALGPSQFPLLGSIETEVRALGLPTFGASLGTSRLDARQRLFITPLAIHVGVADWLTVGASASLVRTKAEELFRLRGDSGRATLGVNPILIGSAVATTNATTIGAYSAAALSLQSRRDDCIASPGSWPECATILAEVAAVSTLISGTAAFASGLTALYGAGLIGGAPYVPLAGSAAEDALRARVDSIRLALERYGVTNVTTTTGLPLGAQAPLAAADLALLITDPVRGFGAKRLKDGGLTAIGDVRLTALIRVHEGARLRQSAYVELRLGTGARARADRLLDQGTGTGFDAITARTITDLRVNPRLAANLSFAITTSFKDEVRMRVPAAAFPGFLEVWRDTVVPVTPGLLFEVGVAPRFRLSESITLAGEWQLFRQGEGTHDLAATVLDPRGASVALSGAALDALSGSVEQRVALSAVFSMLPAIARGLKRPPLDMHYTHAQTLFGHSGVVAKRYEDRIAIRYYTRLFGR